MCQVRVDRAASVGDFSARLVQSRLSDPAGRRWPAGRSRRRTETDWELWGASILDNYGTWHYIGTATTANTIADNNVTLTGYAPPEAGQNLCPPSCKYLAADDARLLMASSWESSTSNTYEVPPSPRRVWWTPAPGSADLADNPASQNERVVITATLQSYLDVEADITGLGGPINGRVYVFSYRRIWELVPTGLVAAPYNRVVISKTIGCVDARSIVEAEDASGQPAVYFMSARGPYRLSLSGGLEYMGHDIKDLTDTWNLAATIPAIGRLSPRQASGLVVDRHHRDRGRTIRRFGSCSIRGSGCLGASGASGPCGRGGARAMGTRQRCRRRARLRTRPARP